jgi:predicted transcriptional regulator
MAEICYIVAMNDTLTIRLGEALAQALNAEARQTGLSKGRIAREALEARLSAGSKVKVMKKYFGVTAGPADLSVNKAYRRDWKRQKA